MTDDMIRSMKSQMIPSDDVVSDLLAKIAGLEASPETTDNVVSFDESGFGRNTEFTTVKPSEKAKTTTKSIWFYGTVAAASAIVLLSTFAMFGGDSSDVQEQFDDIIDNPGIVVDDTNIGENTPDPIDNLSVIGDTTGDKEQDNSSYADTADKEDNSKRGLFSGLFGSSDEDGETDNGSVKNTVQPAGPSDKDAVNDKPDTATSPSDEGNTAAPDKSNQQGQSTATAPPPAPSDGDNSPGGTMEVSDSKVTPGASGTSDISWKREILAESSVSNITVSGTNYVVDSVASSPSVASTTEVKKISLEIPETSTTKHTTVDAKVKKVKNVSEDLMVAVDAEGFKETLLYTNKDYAPSSLGQFIADAGLSQENISFAQAVYLKGEKIGYSSYQRKNIDGIKKIASEYILSNSDAPAASSGAYNSGTVHVLFKSSRNPTQGVIDFGVSDNGYLYVKMASGNSFTFHIGSESANSFIDIVTGM